MPRGIAISRNSEHGAAIVLGPLTIGLILGLPLNTEMPVGTEAGLMLRVENDGFGVTRDDDFGRTGGMSLRASSAISVQQDAWWGQLDVVHSTCSRSNEFGTGAQARKLCRRLGDPSPSVETLRSDLVAMHGGRGMQTRLFGLEAQAWAAFGWVWAGESLFGRGPEATQEWIHRVSGSSEHRNAQYLASSDGPSLHLGYQLPNLLRERGDLGLQMIHSATLSTVMQRVAIQAMSSQAIRLGRVEASIGLGPELLYQNVPDSLLLALRPGWIVQPKGVLRFALGSRWSADYQLVFLQDLEGSIGAFSLHYRP